MTNWDNAASGQPTSGMIGGYSYGGAVSFFRAPIVLQPDAADVVVLGVPFDIATTNRPGARLGPRAIRNASMSIAWARPWPWSTDPFEVLRVVDGGDIPITVSGIETNLAEIESTTQSHLQRGATTLILGGDHLITYAILKAYARHFGSLALIHFDAHTDTWPHTSDGLDHGTMFHRAAAEGIIDPQVSTQIGIRTTNDDTLGFSIVSPAEVARQGAARLAETIARRVADRPVYLTFDIDCLDPAFAPGTGTPVPGGLSSLDALEIIRALKGINLVGMDVVEIAPAYDHAEITALAGAQIAIELLCLYASRKHS